MSNLDDVLRHLHDVAMELPARPGLEPRHEGIELDNIGDGELSMFRNDCVWCKGDTWFTVLTKRLERYHSGTHVQYVWPEASADDRETFVSGTHSVCFDEVFKEDEDE